MRLKLSIGTLQAVVKKAIDAEKASMAIKLEIKRVLGPSVLMEGKIENVIAATNDWMDVLDRTGRSSRLSFKPSITTSLIHHNDPEVRKFAARVIPEKFLGRMVNDKSQAVRAMVAVRVPLNSVREMMKHFPNDDQLRSILKNRTLIESGISKPKDVPLGHDPVEDAERMGDLARTMPGPELSEAWYKQHAQRFLHDYGRNIEYAWEKLAVRRFCSSYKATSGVEIDESKLLKNIKDLIKEKEEHALERDALKETMTWLLAQDENEMLREDMSHDNNEDVDPVRDLVESGVSGAAFIEGAAKLFNVKVSTLPLGMRKYRLGEGNAKQTLVPVVGMLPHKHGFRAIDERALDAFCENWTRAQALAGEPLKLEWTNHPVDANKIGFTCILR